MSIIITFSRDIITWVTGEQPDFHRTGVVVLRFLVFAMAFFIVNFFAALLFLQPYRIHAKARLLDQFCDEQPSAAATADE